MPVPISVSVREFANLYRDAVSVLGKMNIAVKGNTTEDHSYKEHVTALKTGISNAKNSSGFQFVSQNELEQAATCIDNALEKICKPDESGNRGHDLEVRVGAADGISETTGQMKIICVDLMSLAAKMATSINTARQVRIRAIRELSNAADAVIKRAVT